jgi:2'-hydroxyisoflavone reductase
MRILVLGGTGFVGRAIADAAGKSGHQVTLFNRGRSPAPGIRTLIGDRDTGDYAALSGRRFDAVADVTGYFPWQVGQAADAVGQVGRYLFISSHVVFDGGSTALRPPITDAVPPLTDATYGPSKVACEQKILSLYGRRATVVRPGKVAGPNDNQDGLTYWVRRASRGGPIAVPGSPAQPVQLVDSRDLAAFVVGLLEADRGGAYTAVGPPTTLGDLIRTCAAVAGTEVDLVPVPLDRAPQPFPLVKTPELWPTQLRDPAPGMPVTPLARTAADVLAWDRARGEPPLSRGFTDEAEAGIIAPG